MSGCCTVPKTEPVLAVDACPACGARGRAVQSMTVRAILKPELAARVADDKAYRLCPNPACEHLYFGEGWVATKRDASVRVGMKEDTGPVPVCYCFGYTRADVRTEVAETGRSTISERIAKEVKAGNCACETKNPAGTCCLGEVKKAEKAALAERNTRVGEDP